VAEPVVADAFSQDSAQPKPPASDCSPPDLEALEAERDRTAYWTGRAHGAESLHAQAIKERDEARREFGFLYDAVSDAEKVDTNAGDSAVSVVLWSFAERRSLLAGVPGGSGQGVEGLLSEDDLAVHREDQEGGDRGRSPVVKGDEA
jgi:hypothetical protein